MVHLTRKIWILDAVVTSREKGSFEIVLHFGDPHHITVMFSNSLLCKAEGRKWRKKQLIFSVGVKFEALVYSQQV